jgi:hypothetical protein
MVSGKMIIVSRQIGRGKEVAGSGEVAHCMRRSSSGIV